MGTAVPPPLFSATPKVEFVLVRVMLLDMILIGIYIALNNHFIIQKDTCTCRLVTRRSIHLAARGLVLDLAAL